MVGRLETPIFASHLTVTDLRRLIVGVKNAGPPPIPGPRAGPGATPDRQYWGCLRQWPTPRDRKRPMPGETSLCFDTTPASRSAHAAVSVGNHLGARPTLDDRLDLAEGTDGGPLPRSLDEQGGCLDLWSHRTCSEGQCTQLC
jgi:hypothetical protein